MGDINIKQLESLRWRMRVIETLTVIGTAWIALAVYQKKEELVYYFKDSYRGQYVSLGTAGNMPQGFAIEIPPKVEVLYAIPSAKKTVRL